MLRGNSSKRRRRARSQRERDDELERLSKAMDSMDLDVPYATRKTWIRAGYSLATAAVSNESDVARELLDIMIEEKEKEEKILDLGNNLHSMTLQELEDNFDDSDIEEEKEEEDEEEDDDETEEEEDDDDHDDDDDDLDADSAFIGEIDDRCSRMGRTAAHWACVAGHTEILEMIIKAGADLDIQDCMGDTPLHLCKGSACVSTLAKNDANLCLRNYSGESAAMRFVRRGETKHLAALAECQRDFDANATIDDGRTILHIACSLGNAEAVEILLRSGADGTRKTFDGRTPLLEASQSPLCHVDVLHALFEGVPNLNLNVSDIRSGRTPLLHCAARGLAAGVKALASKGANWNICTPEGLNAFDLALQGKHWRCADELVRANPELVGSRAVAVTCGRKGEFGAFYCWEAATTPLICGKRDSAFSPAAVAAIDVYAAELKER
eukprot:g5113.t1